jgi:hypothetical protein
MIQGSRKVLVASGARVANRSMSFLSSSEVFPVEAHNDNRNVVETTIQSGTQNGLKYATVNKFNQPVVDINFSIRAGSQFESEAQQGSAQLLSVAAFAGTRNRSGLALCRYLEDIGATFGATADREKINYSVTVPSNNVDNAFSAIASAIVSSPSHAYIYDEIKPTAQIWYDALSKSPKLQLEELIHEAAFGDNTPLGQSFYANSLDNIHGEDVLEFRSKQFLAGNITIAAKGISQDNLTKNISHFFRSLPEGSSELPKSTFVSGFAKTNSFLNGYSGAAFAFPIASGDKGVASVVARAIDNKVSSLRLPKGSVAPFFKQYLNGGIFGYYFVGDIAEVNSNIKAVADQFKSFSAGSAKNQVALSTIEGIHNRCGSSTLYNYANLGLTSSDLDTRNLTDAAIASALSASLKSGPAYAVLGKTRGLHSHNAVSGLFK